MIDIASEIEDDRILEAAKSLNARTPDPDLETYILDQDVDAIVDDFEDDIIRHLAEKDVLGEGRFRTIPVYGKMENPAYLDPTGAKGQTSFEVDYKYDADGDIIDESGSGIDLLETLNDKLYDYDVDQSTRQALLGDVQEAMLDGEITADELYKKITEGGHYIEDYDSGSLTANNEFFRDVMEAMGHDGIIVDADHYFGRRGRGMTHTGGAYHYMFFEPNQVKSSSGNTGADRKSVV